MTVGPWSARTAGLLDSSLTDGLLTGHEDLLRLEKFTAEREICAEIELTYNQTGPLGQLERHYANVISAS